MAFKIEELIIDDETVEFNLIFDSVGIKKHITTVNHDEIGWSGIDEVKSVIVRIADLLGWEYEIKEDQPFDRDSIYPEIKQRAELYNWSVEKRFETPYLRGDIYNDSTSRFADGTRVSTSRLQEVNYQDGWARTNNSIYWLM